MIFQETWNWTEWTTQSKTGFSFQQGQVATIQWARGPNFLRAELLMIFIARENTVIRVFLEIDKMDRGWKREHRQIHRRNEDCASEGVVRNRPSTINFRFRVFNSSDFLLHYSIAEEFLERCEEGVWHCKGVFRLLVRICFILERIQLNIKVSSFVLLRRIYLRSVTNLHCVFWHFRPFVRSYIIFWCVSRLILRSNLATVLRISELRSPIFIACAVCIAWRVAPSIFERIYHVY